MLLFSSTMLALGVGIRLTVTTGKYSSAWCSLRIVRGNPCHVTLCSQRLRSHLVTASSS